MRKWLVRLFNTVFAVCIFAASPMGGALKAADCRVLINIPHSANLANNEADGGHLNEHVFLSDYPQQGGPGVAFNNTMFLSPDDWNAVWNQYANLNLPIAPAGALPGLPVPDCNDELADAAVEVNVLAAYLPAVAEAGICIGVNAQNDRVCSDIEDDDNFVPAQFRFVFARSNLGDWKILTAFPMQ